MTQYERGIYELLITEFAHTRISDIDPTTRIVSKLLPAEASDRVAVHLERLIRRAVEDVAEKDRVNFAIQVARRIAEELSKQSGVSALPEDLIRDPGEVLRAIVALRPDGSPEEILYPVTPLLDTALLTNAPREPRIGNQLASEIPSADRIDAVIAFIRRSGIRPLLESLRTHCDAGRPLRVLTTTYTGSTEPRALEDLIGAGAKVRVSYDNTSTRLHAKAWLFHRKSGYSTAFIGSSNLSHSAMMSGLEWNVRVSGIRNPDVIESINAVFDTYWNGSDFEEYDADRFAAAIGKATRPKSTTVLSPIELRPEPFQERLLEQIALARALGHHRNLLVSATGTGKTVMAAIDYARLRQVLPRARLLFVAHREEILEKSMATFRHCLRDHAFAELWVGGKRPQDFANVFASIQSLSAAKPTTFDPQHFDVVIIDEFHHAAAPSYRWLLDHVKPVELLGLTATPERSDGLSILDWFDNRVAAELRLWDAIDQHRLAPFVYYGIHDGLDLRDVPWQRGRGYDVEGLTNLITANDVWTKHVLAQLSRRIDDIDSARILGFCVSVAHAQYMARVFNEAGVKARAVWGDSPDGERTSALSDLAARRITVLFSVDLFNEGIDIPEVDTLLMLRPTDSATLFIQQLGRGLRKSHGKTVCTVLDFVGHHRKEFRFDRRLGALLTGSRKQLIDQIEQGFPYLPAGCHMELDRVAAEIVIENIRNAVPSKWAAKAEELRQLARDGRQVSLASYLSETDLELDDVYANNHSWSDLRADAGLGPEAKDAQEKTMRRACSRMLHVDDLERIGAYRRFLEEVKPPDFDALNERDQRLLRMLLASMTSAKTRTEALAQLWGCEAVRRELLDLLEVLESRVSHIHTRIEIPPNVPVLIHARYTRDEILAGFGATGEVVAPDWREGVRWLKSALADLLVFTLDKSSDHFSPTTRYKDYAISPELIHWESQSRTSAASETGQRYQFHKQFGSTVHLFARLNNEERAFWYLGPADYVKHESETPMAITWRLHTSLPGDLFAAFAAAVA
jgi:superfamily II DNA or RNA helicase/HKD family nuclease